MLDGGYIKLHRKLTKWEWYHNANTFRVFIHLLLTANYERRNFEGRTIERGQRVTSISKLSQELKVSVQSIRTALDHLKSTGELTIKTTPKYTIITINNYISYQQLTNELTNDQQTTNKQLTNDQQQWKKDKESKRKIKKRERGALSPHGQFLNVFLSDAEVADLAEKYPHHYQSKIERLSRFIESHGKDYPNHYIKLMDWLEEDVGEPGQTQDDTTASSYDIDELEEINTLDYID